MEPIMKIKLFITFLTLITSASAFADEKTIPPMDQAKMDAWIKASTPGEEHKLLQQYVGKWDHTIKMWTAPGSAVSESKGTTEVESLLGGRFIRQSVKGVSMGQEFEGIGITGFDNIQKQFSTFWIDNMSTASMIGKGSFDKAKNVIMDEGSFSCPESSTGKRSYRAVWTLPVKDSYKYEMYTTDDKGKEFRMMEIVYTKAK